MPTLTPRPSPAPPPRAPAGVAGRTPSREPEGAVGRSPSRARNDPARSATGDHGQAVPLLAAVLIVAAAVMLAMVPLARGAAERAAAQTAADAAALAGAAEGEESARSVAAANGAEIVDYRAWRGDVWVEVTVGGARAEARARRETRAG